MEIEIKINDSFDYSNHDEEMEKDYKKFFDIVEKAVLR